MQWIDHLLSKHHASDNETEQLHDQLLDRLVLEGHGLSFYWWYGPKWCAHNIWVENETLFIMITNEAYIPDLRHKLPINTMIPPLSEAAKKIYRYLYSERK